LTVYWHGPVPADIAGLFASLRPGIRVDVKSAAYSAAELDQAVNQVLHATSAVRAMDVRAAPDGSGIIVGVAGALPSVSGQRLFGTSVPVQLQSLTFTLHQQTRTADKPLFWGGAVINGPQGQCSSGFGAHDSNGITYMVSAAHCSSGNSTYRFTNGNATATLGPMTGRVPSHDDGLIVTTSGNAYYDSPGVLAGDTSNYKTVAGQGALNLGNSVCESGAFGGVHCGLIVEETGINNVLTSSGTRVNGLTLTSLASDGTLTVDGDSGGPVFSLAPNNRVTAKGIILGWVADNEGNLSEGVMPMTTITSDFGVHVNTG
jgi:hypothetical protein